MFAPARHSARPGSRHELCLILLACAGSAHGALLAAQACGCSIESGALAYFRQDLGAGGGIVAAHASSAERMRRLMPFAESALRLATPAQH